MVARHKWDGKEDWSVKTVLNSKEKAALQLASIREDRPQQDILHDALIQYLKDRSAPSQIVGAMVSEGGEVPGAAL